MSGTESSATDVTARLDRVLNTPRRRFVLAYLLTRRQRVSVDELAAALDTWERVHRESSIRTTRDQHRVGLCHVHLPTLADADLLGFDRQTEQVELLVEPDRLAESLTGPSTRSESATVESNSAT